MLFQFLQTGIGTDLGKLSQEAQLPIFGDDFLIAYIIAEGVENLE